MKDENERVKDEDIRDGFVRCDRCKGKRTVFPVTEAFGLIKCKKCDGTGVVDWIENVVGKKEKKNIKNFTGSTGPG